MALFYLPEVKDGITQLSPEESRHAIKVLRMAEGDTIELIDGQGGWYEAKVTDANQKKCTFKIEKSKTEVAKDFHIHVAISPTKSIDRIEWFVEKAVEIGIDEITFLLCQNSERKVIKADRIEKKAISAVKQSLKARLPKINPLIPYASFLESVVQKDKFIAYVDFHNPQMLHHIAKPKSSYCVLIGPEGDFSTSELEKALGKGYKKISLGPSRLRTETAGLMACHLLNVINQ